MDVYGWLRTDASSPGVLFVHPPGYDTSRFIGAVTQSLLRSGQVSVLFMTQESEKLTQAVGVPLPNEIFISYGTSPLLMSALQQDIWIVVDSVNLFRTLRIGELARQRGPRCRFLVFTTLGFNHMDLAYLNESLPGIWSFYGSFADRRLEVELFLIESEMSSRQEERFGRRKQEEAVLSRGSSNERHRARERLLTLQIGNFVYPEEIQSNLDRVRSSREISLPDTLSPTGWIPLDPTGILAENPKLQNLLTIASMDRNKKHVIYTRFKERHGTSLIASLLRSFHQVPVIEITGDLSSQQRLASIDEFNRAESGIIVTSVTPATDLRDVRNLHFFDSISEEVYKSFMEKIFKVELLPDRSRVNVYIYVAKPREGEGPDTINYRNFSGKLDTQTNLYNKVIMGSVPVIYEGTTGKILPLFPEDTDIV